MRSVLAVIVLSSAFETQFAGWIACGIVQVDRPTSGQRQQRDDVPRCASTLIVPPCSAVFVANRFGMLPLMAELLMISLSRPITERKTGRTGAWATGLLMVSVIGGSAVTLIVPLLVVMPTTVSTVPTIRLPELRNEKSWPNPVTLPARMLTWLRFVRATPLTDEMRRSGTFRKAVPVSLTPPPVMSEKLVK